MEHKFNINLFKSSIFAGIAISIGCMIYLTLGGVIGAIAFSFGLLTVVHYKSALYTGYCGFIQLFGNGTHTQTWIDVLTVIGGNIFGCLIAAISAHLAGLPILEAGLTLVSSRLDLSLIEVFFRAIGCGLIMTTAVKFARENRFLPLLFGVPLFICCGFLHSIADSFYYLYGCLDTPNTRFILPLIITYLGNYVGCNTYKVFLDYPCGC